MGPPGLELMKSGHLSFAWHIWLVSSFTACSDKNRFLLIETGVRERPPADIVGQRPAGFECYLSSWGSTRRLQHIEGSLSFFRHKQIFDIFHCCDSQEGGQCVCPISMPE